MYIRIRICCVGFSIKTSIEAKVTPAAKPTLHLHKHLATTMHNKGLKILRVS